jgi:hypothetical protein
VFYLRYHGYSKFFSLWALARYRNLKDRQYARGGVRDVVGGAAGQKLSACGSSSGKWLVGKR